MFMPQKVNLRGLVRASLLGARRTKWPFSAAVSPKQRLQQHACEAVLSWKLWGDTVAVSLLGLLAKIKCSICSYQLNIWYGTHWVPRILWLIFGSRLRKRGLPPPSHGLSRYCTTSEYGPFPSGKLVKQQKTYSNVDLATCLPSKKEFWQFSNVFLLGFPLGLTYRVTRLWNCYPTSETAQ